MLRVASNYRDEQGGLAPTEEAVMAFLQERLESS
jgi:hypothetical protein